MLALGYDTATPWGTMALVEDGEIIFEISLKAGKGSGEYLLALLQTLLKKTGHKIGDLDLIAVGNGPGSYTGIRVGLATAKGLAQAVNNRVVYGVSTLRIIAENARYSSDMIASIIDARRGNVYAALYKNNNEELINIEEPMIIDATEFALKIADLPSVMLCGDGSTIHQAIWKKYTNLRIAPTEWDRPLGSAAARIGCKEFKLPTGTAEHLVPCYLRKVEAEVRLEESLCNQKSNQCRSKI